MDLDSVWVSVLPLMAFNVVLLCTVLIFRPIYLKRERTQVIEDRPASKFLNRWMKEYWIWLTEPIVDLFVKFRLSPNILTTIGVVISCGAAYFFATAHLGLGGWLMIFAATFDMFDGSVARKTKQVSRSGAYYDSVMDRVSEGVVFIGLAFLYRAHWALFFVVLALIGSFLVSYAKARGDASGIDYSGGSMQRPERIVYLGVGAVFAPVFSVFLHPYFPWATALTLYLIPLCFVALATCMTSYHRISTVMALLDKSSQNIK